MSQGQLVFPSPSADDPQTMIFKRQLQIVFLQLDPVLKSLLNEITAIKTLFDHPPSSDGMVPDDAWFPMVDGISKQLLDLSRHFRSFGVEFAPSMILLAVYVALPLTALFHLQLPEKVQELNLRALRERTAEQASEIHRRTITQRSYLQKVLASTAIAIQSYVETCSTPIDSSLTSDTNPCSAGSTDSLGEKYLVKFLIALVSCFPPSSEVERVYSNTDNNDDNKEIEHRGNLLLGIKGSLGDGTDMWVAVLQATRFIISCCSEEQLLDAWHGTLMMRLVDCTMAFLITSRAGDSDERELFSSKVQVVAVEQMKTLLQRTYNATSFWQSVFPGVFSPLYKVAMNVSSLHHNYSGKKYNQENGCILSLEHGSMECIVLLFQNSLVRSLARENNERNRDRTLVLSKDASLAKELATMAMRSNEKKSAVSVKGASSPIDDSDQSFVHRIKTRVAIPLQILLNHKAVSRSKEIRKVVLSLCRIILVEARICWFRAPLMEPGSDDSSEEFMIIEETPLEISIALQQDPHEDVASQATKTVKDYTALSTNSKIGVDASSQWITRRVIELVEGLPVILTRGKRTEIAFELQKTTGYIRCLKNGLNSALLDSMSFQQALFQLMDIDFEDSEKLRKPTAVVRDLNNSALKYRRMDSDLAESAKNMIRTIGESQGPKQAALSIDAILSNFFEAESDVPSHFSARVTWLHEWTGSLVVAREILIGAFSYGEGPLEEKKRSRILRSLGSSVLPLVVNSRLWRLLLPNEELAAEKVPDRSVPKLAQANECVFVLLMELVQTFCVLLDPEGLDTLLTTILHPIVETASQDQSRLAQETAEQVLKSIGHKLRRRGVEDLLYFEQDRLVASMHGKLRLPGGIHTPSHHDAKNILAVARTFRWILESVMKHNVESAGERGMGMSSMVDLMSLLQYKLDHLVYQKQMSDRNFQDLCSLHKVFFDYYLWSFGVRDDRVYSYKMGGAESESRHPWLDVLNNFREGATLELVHEEKLQPCEGVDLDDQMYLKVAKDEIDLFSTLIARNCYLLSNHELSVRVASCQGLISGFKFLAFVGNVHEDPKDDQNIIRNSILRQVADSWPSIKARLRSLSEEIQSADTRAVSLVFASPPMAQSRNDRSSDLSFKRIFLAYLFDLIAFLCECSGDFMADRLRNTVFPVMASWLRDILQRNTSSKLHPTSTTSPMSLPPSSINQSAKIWSSECTNFNLDGRFRWNESERKLFLSIVRCLGRILQQEDCGKSLFSILSQAGQMLLACLDVDDDVEVEASVMECLKSILLVDSGVLRRALLDLSECGVPPCPLKRHLKGHSENGDVAFRSAAIDQPRNISIAGDFHRSSNLLRARCQELLCFVQSLPEQSSGV